MMAESLIASEIYISMDVFTACSIGHLHTVQKIIRSSANGKEALLETRSKKRKWTPLMYAAQGGHSDVVIYLLKQGALVTAKNNHGQIALMIAAKYGHHKCVEALVGSINIDKTDHQGGTALSYAVRSGHRDIVNFLLEKKCSANAFYGSNVSPLIIAAAAGHEMIVQDLLEHNADIFFCTETGSTATYMAVKNKNHKVLGVIENYLMSTKLGAEKAMDGNWIEEKDSSSLKKILKASNLSCYDAFFQSNGINIMTFWSLTIQDLKNIGIFLPGDIQKLMDIISKRRHLCYKEFHLTKLVRSYMDLQHQIIKAENDLSEVKKHKSDIKKERFNLLWVQYKISKLQGFIMDYGLKNKITEVQKIFVKLKPDHTDQGPIFSLENVLFILNVLKDLENWITDADKFCAKQLV